MTKTKKFSAELQSLYEMLAFVHKECLDRGFDSCKADKVTLAVEEAVVNIIIHGYKGKNESKKSIIIKCEDCSTKQKGIKITIKDHGIPFNPLERMGLLEERLQKPSEEDPSIGGYGIFLYIEIMDKIEYTSDLEGNLLCLIKYLNK